MSDYLVICPCCFRPMKIGESKTDKHLLKYYCSVCKTGIDSDSFGIPLGFPETNDIRRKRILAHRLFEDTYVKHNLSKRKAYMWLGDILHIPKKKAHISRLSENQLDYLISMLQKN